MQAFLIGGQDLATGGRAAPSSLLQDSPYLPLQGEQVPAMPTAKAAHGQRSRRARHPLICFATSPAFPHRRIHSGALYPQPPGHLADPAPPPHPHGAAPISPPPPPPPPPQLVALIVPVDPTPDGAAPEFVLGSHRCGGGGKGVGRGGGHYVRVS